MELRKAHLRCEFVALDDNFNFGKFKGFSMADILDLEPSYVEWCMKNCTGMEFLMYDEVIDQIKIAYPKFCMDDRFERIRNNRLRFRHEYPEFEDDDFESDEQDDIFSLRCDEYPSYDKYSGSWAQEEAGYSDDDIDTIFDGDPLAYWNID